MGNLVTGTNTRPEIACPEPAPLKDAQRRVTVLPSRKPP